MLNQNITSTKFIVCYTIIVLSFVLVVLRMLDALDWFKWAVGLVAVYTTGNTISKLVKPDSAE